MFLGNLLSSIVEEDIDNNQEQIITDSNKIKKETTIKTNEEKHSHSHSHSHQPKTTETNNPLANQNENHNQENQPIHSSHENPAIHDTLGKSIIIHNYSDAKQKGTLLINNNENISVWERVSQAIGYQSDSFDTLDQQNSLLQYLSLIKQNNENKITQSNLNNVYLENESLKLQNKQLNSQLSELQKHYQSLQKEKGSPNQLSNSFFELVKELEKTKEKLKETTFLYDQKTCLVEELKASIQSCRDEQYKLIQVLKDEFEKQAENYENFYPSESVFLELLNQEKEQSAKRQEEINRLSNRFIESEKQRTQLEMVINRLDSLLRETMNQLKDSKSVDKQLVNSLIISYITKNDQRDEILNVMSKILDWDQNTKSEVGFNSQSGWSWLWNSDNSRKQMPKNITDLWVSFLLESAKDEIEEQFLATEKS